MVWSQMGICAINLVIAVSEARETGRVPVPPSAPAVFYLLLSDIWPGRAFQDLLGLHIYSLFTLQPFMLNTLGIAGRFSKVFTNISSVRYHVY